MTHPPPDMPWHEGIERSRLFVMVWSADSAYAGTQRSKLAYAMALGKPVRVITLDDVRVPEDLCAGYADFQVARFASVPHEPPRDQIIRWLHELDEKEA